MNFLRRLALQEKILADSSRLHVGVKSRASLTCFRACFLPGRAKDLSAPRYVIPRVRCWNFPVTFDSTARPELQILPGTVENWELRTVTIALCEKDVQYELAQCGGKPLPVGLLWDPDGGSGQAWYWNEPWIRTYCLWRSHLDLSWLQFLPPGIFDSVVLSVSLRLRRCFRNKKLYVENTHVCIILLSGIVTKL